MQSDTSPPRRVQAVGISFMLLGMLACIAFLAAKHRTTTQIDSLEARVDALSNRVEDLRTGVEPKRPDLASEDLEEEAGNLREQLVGFSEAIGNIRRDDQVAFSTQNLAFLLYIVFTLLGVCLVAFVTWQTHRCSSSKSPKTEPSRPPENRN